MIYTYHTFHVQIPCYHTLAEKKEKARQQLVAVQGAWRALGWPTQIPARWGHQNHPLDLW